MAIKPFFTQDGVNVNNFFIANTTALAVGSNLVINTTALFINTIALYANGSVGTNGQFLASNGTSAYWATPAGGSTNTAAQYTWTNTHTFNSNVTLGTSAGLIANASVGTNGQFLASNGTTIFWATPSASATAGGPNTAVQFANGTVIAGNNQFTFDYTTGRVKIGPGVGFDFTTSALDVDGTANSYIQIVMQNSNTGNNASADFVVTSDSGNDSVDYVDLGINSSTYANASFNVIGAKDGYLYASNGHLAIGTLSAKEIRFHANGATSTNEILSLNSSAIEITSNIALWANGSAGSSGQVLTSNGTGTYWATASGTASVPDPVAIMISAGQAWF